MWTETSVSETKEMKAIGRILLIGVVVLALLSLTGCVVIT